MASVYDQLNFSGEVRCESFIVNKARLNLPRGKYVCLDCSVEFLQHQSSSFTPDDIVSYLNFISSRDGGSCILDTDTTCMNSSKQLGKLYLGSFCMSVNPFVKDHNIKAIVNCSDLHRSDRSDFRKWTEKVQVLEEKNIIVVLRLGWIDSIEQILGRVSKYDQLIEAVEFIHHARLNNQNVAVHCAQGKSRSSTVVIAYLMAINNLSFEQSLIFVQSIRAIAQPNIGFVAQLKAFESSSELHHLRSRLALEVYI